MSHKKAIAMLKNSPTKTLPGKISPGVIGLVLLLMSLSTSAQTNSDDGKFVGAENGQPLVEVSAETTRLVGPLDENGDVDFFRAVEVRRSKGVTAENNAIVPFVRALGPTAAGLNLPDSFFKKLGISPPEAKANEAAENTQRYDSFTRWGKTAEADSQRPQLLPQYNFAIDHPWTPELLPDLERWADSQSAVLEKIRTGLLKKQAYIPMVAMEGEYPKLVRARLPILAEINALRYNLAIAAMRELGLKKIDRSIDWVEAIYQLSDHARQDCASSIEIITANACKRLGHQTLVRILRSNLASDKNIARIDELLKQYPPSPFPFDDFDTYERWAAIDTVVAIGRGKFEFNPDPQNVDLSPLLLADCDFLVTIDLINNRMDELVETAKTEGELLRRSQLWKLRDLSRERVDKAINGVAASVASTDPQTRGKFLGEMLWGSLAPAACIQSSMHTRSIALYRMARIETALAQFRLASSAYPESLEELKPEYLKSIPEDPFHFKSKNFYYQSDGQTYGLYSNGSFQIQLDQKLVDEYEAAPHRSPWDHGLTPRYPKTWAQVQEK